MNHQKIYEQIIENAKFKNRKKLKKNHLNYIYYENHHILPRCLNGSVNKNNLVLLTAKEHYLCHKLLTYIYKGNRKIACAFHKMTYGNTGNYNKSSRDYGYARELISKIPISEETRKKISKSISGERNGQFGKPGFALGYKFTKEQKENIRKSKLGDKNPQFGKPGFALGYKFTKEQKENCSKAQKKRLQNKENHPRYGIKISKETKRKISQSLKNRKK
jgi:hypothetical protein